MKYLFAFLLIASVASASQISVSWTDNSTAEDGFIVERSLDGGKTFAEVARVQPNTTSFDDDIQSPDAPQPQSYRITAFQNNGRRSDPSNVTTWVPPDPTALAAPSNAQTATKP